MVGVGTWSSIAFNTVIEKSGSLPAGFFDSYNDDKVREEEDITPASASSNAPEVRTPLQEGTNSTRRLHKRY